MIHYARVLEKGIGVKRDINKALKYLKRCIDRDDERAIEPYERLLKSRHNYEDDSDESSSSDSDEFISSDSDESSSSDSDESSSSDSDCFD